LYGVFVWARRALNSQKRRFPARAVIIEGLIGLRAALGPGRQSHSVTTLYISLVILHTKFAGWRENDFSVHT
jgi:hypothetical protein